MNLLSKGNFKPIDKNFITESINALDAISKVQHKYKKFDMDAFFNELHDSMVGSLLGFNLINVDKHGFDCKLSHNKDIFLESKTTSFASSSWSATFNDTTYEKAELFKSKNVWLALSVWEDVTKLHFICYGQHEGIGDYLKEGVDKHKNGKVGRSTQTIFFSKLISDFQFKIYSPFLSRDEAFSKLIYKIKPLRKLGKSVILEANDALGIGQ